MHERKTRRGELCYLTIWKRKKEAWKKELDAKTKTLHNTNLNRCLFNPAMTEERLHPSYRLWCRLWTCKRAYLSHNWYQLSVMPPNLNPIAVTTSSKTCRYIRWWKQFDERCSQCSRWKWKRHNIGVSVNVYRVHPRCLGETCPFWLECLLIF